MTRHNPIEWIEADWPLAGRIRALTTTRHGGVSALPFDSFNLGQRCGDDPEAVATNRHRLIDHLPTLEGPCWMRQVHGVQVVEADPAAVPEADAQWTARPDLALAVLTADCLPVVLGDRQARVVAVAHAGWRGLAAGVLETAVAALPVDAADLTAWIGPAIGRDAYEVGGEVREAFVGMDAATGAAFRPSGRPGHWLADLPWLAGRALTLAGVGDVVPCGLCTHADSRFFSYRRDAGLTGRMATLAWIRS